MRVTDKYVLFWGGDCVFSNFHPCSFTVDGVQYNCSEQYFMAEKARLFKDDASLQQILAANNARDQKALGRKVVGFDQTAWDAQAKDVMYKGCMAKFNQDITLLGELLRTGTKTLVEASPRDTIWGIGLHWKDKACDDSANWKGKNLLGEVLTKVRDDLVKEIQKARDIAS